MKQFITTAGLSFLLTLFCTISLSAQETSSLPSIDVQSLSGEQVDISEHGENDKLTIISFWATWCSPCKKELDAISEIYEEWQEEYDVELVAISIDNARSIAKVGPLVEQKGWPFQIYIDSKQALKNSMQFQSVPQTYIVDKSGAIVYAHTGYLPGDEFELEEKLEELSE